MQCMLTHDSVKQLVRALETSNGSELTRPGGVILWATNARRSSARVLEWGSLLAMMVEIRRGQMLTEAAVRSMCG